MTDIKEILEATKIAKTMKLKYYISESKIFSNITYGDVDQDFLYFGKLKNNMFDKVDLKEFQKSTYNNCIPDGSKMKSINLLNLTREEYKTYLNIIKSDDRVRKFLHCIYLGGNYLYMTNGAILFKKYNHFREITDDFYQKTYMIPLPPITNFKGNCKITYNTNNNEGNKIEYFCYEFENFNIYYFIQDFGDFPDVEKVIKDYTSTFTFDICLDLQSIDQDTIKIIKKMKKYKYITFENNLIKIDDKIINNQQTKNKTIEPIILNIDFLLDVLDLGIIHLTQGKNKVLFQQSLTKDEKTVLLMPIKEWE